MIGRIIFCIFLFQTIEGRARHGIGTPPPVPQSQKKWMTLNGGQPEVIASGGYSGFFPDSSLYAYDMAGDFSIAGTILYCNVHFSKDGDGFCVPQMNLQNDTTIDQFDPKGVKTYDVYGQQIRGYFGIDYPAKIIYENVTLRQNNFKRQGVFDGAAIQGPYQLIEDKNGRPTRLWLNIEYEMFYKQHGVDARAYLLQMELMPEFISSTEIGFLKSFAPQLGKSKTKLVFKFMEETVVEPTTKQMYGSLAKNLAMIKAFAYGIMVPKEYIWPVNNARILQPATTLVQDAHKAGLAVYASGFANDNFISFNYSYDPAREYLNFIDNSKFSVDGFLSEFPSTASQAIGCLPGQNKNAARVIETPIISHNGASGDYPGCTDLAYQKAIEDGADIIDCSVQMTKDGVAFCSDRPDLMKTSTAVSLFMDQATNIPEIQKPDGIFSFDLTWEEIQSLKPQIESFFEGELIRNPANKNSGKFVTLAQFLELAKAKAVPGVLITIENAAYLASKKGLDIVGTVMTALSNATLDKQTKQKVLIQSDDSSVLLKFKDNPNYQRVLHLEKSVSGAPAPVAHEVKKYADAVFVHRDAIVTASDNFAFNFTMTIPQMHAANISVFVGFLKNEFENLIFDYLSDPYVELATLYLLQADAVVTDYPATANAFFRSSCTTNGSAYILQPMKPGFLFEANPIADPPLLSTADILDPPLPSVAKTPNAGSQSPSESPASDSVPESQTSKPAPPPKRSSSAWRMRASRKSAVPKGLFLAAMVALLTIYS